jgi:hypothetical protein
MKISQSVTLLRPKKGMAAKSEEFIEQGKEIYS